MLPKQLMLIKKIYNTRKARLNITLDYIMASDSEFSNYVNFLNIIALKMNDKIIRKIDTGYEPI